jgi:hypothetical protein
MRISPVVLSGDIACSARQPFDKDMFSLMARWLLVEVWVRNEVLPGLGMV